MAIGGGSGAFFADGLLLFVEGEPAVVFLEETAVADLAGEVDGVAGVLDGLVEVSSFGEGGGEGADSLNIRAGLFDGELGEADGFGAVAGFFVGAAPVG